jgi:hypothetical protein
MKTTHINHNFSNQKMSNSLTSFSIKFSSIFNFILAKIYERKILKIAKKYNKNPQSFLTHQDFWQKIS